MITVFKNIYKGEQTILQKSKHTKAWLSERWANKINKVLIKYKERVSVSVSVSAGYEMCIATKQRYKYLTLRKILIKFMLKQWFLNFRCSSTPWE